MDASSVIAFWGVAILLIVTPGADWAFTLGSRMVLPAVAGLTVGYTMVTLVVAAGVGAIVAGTPTILTALTVAGGVYLVWHGATTLAKPVRIGVVDTGTGWKTLTKGIGVSGLNAKGLLIFLALMPQFTDPASGWPIAAQIGLLGLIFTVSCAIFYTCIGLLARTILRMRPAASRTIGVVSGAAMVVIGLTLIAERLIR